MTQITKTGPFCLRKLFLIMISSDIGIRKNNEKEICLGREKKK